ncbi:MAG: hypothetical protein Q8N88_04935 [Nanoarchaeota archaeon]|nr:hypothetical protein [Nanoarchaeota archaeon]
MREKRGWLEQTLLPIALTGTLLYFSSCSYVGEKFFGKEYYNEVVKRDCEIFRPDTISMQSQKIMDDIYYTTTRLTDQKP